MRRQNQLKASTCPDKVRKKKSSFSDVLSSLVSIGESRLKFMLQQMNLISSRSRARQNFSELTELFKEFGFNFQNRSIWFGSIFGVFRKIILRFKRKRKRNARKAEKRLIKLNVILILKSRGINSSWVSLERVKYKIKINYELRKFYPTGVYY